MDTRQERLLDLLERWSEAKQRGQPVSIAQVCADCPELAGELERMAHAAEQFERLASETAEHTPVVSKPPPAPALQRWKRRLMVAVGAVLLVLAVVVVLAFVGWINR
jgi:hypothetical protein